MKEVKWNKLIELLLIILIPIIFLIISIPPVVSTIKEYRKLNFITTSKLIAVNAEIKHIENNLNNIDDVITCESVFKLNTKDYKSCSIYIDNNTAQVTIFGNEKYEGLNICSGTKDKVSLVDNCDGICIMNDFIEVKTPYELNSYKSCVNYTKDLFINTRKYTVEKLNSFCKGEVVDGWTFSDNIEYMINKGYTEDELVKNGVIKGNINNICIPNEVHIACYEYDVYGKNGGRYAEITGYDDLCGSNIVIPEKIDGIKVEGIGDSAFHGTNVSSVKFPSTIRYIDSNAFRGAGENHNSSGVKLTGTLDMSNIEKLDSIGYFAFADNEITEVKFPSSIKELDGYSFSGNQITGELDLSNTNLSIIGEYAFSSSKITSIKLPKNITTIGYTAFAGNKINGELDLSQYEKLTSISGEVFANNLLTNVILPKNIISIDKDAFYNNKISGELDLSSYMNLKTINGFANNEITGIKLPESVIEIGKNAFSNNNIEKLDLSLNTNLIKISSFAFLNNEITSIKLPSSIRAIEDSAFYKGKESNPNLISIINLSENSFNWNIITKEGEVNKCTFVTGTCDNIKVSNK